MNGKMKPLIFIYAIGAAIAIQVPTSWENPNVEKSINKQSNAGDVIDTGYEYISSTDERDSLGKLKVASGDDTYKPQRWIPDERTTKWTPLKYRSRYKKKPIIQQVGYKTIISRTPNTNIVQNGPKIIINQPYLRPLPHEPRLRNNPIRNNVPYISHRLPIKKRVYRKESETKYPNVVYDPFVTKEHRHNTFPISDGLNIIPILPDQISEFDPFQNSQYYNVKQQKNIEEVPPNVFRSIQHLTPFTANINNNSPSFILNKNPNINELTPQNHQPGYNIKEAFQNHLTKNYRDDKTHEQFIQDREYDTEEAPEIERDVDEQAPVTVNEQPREIPTKPIYPGEGKWAKPGIKYRPYVNQHKYKELEETQGTPDGYDTFVGGQRLFIRNKNNFDQALHEFPQQHGFSNILPKQEVEQVEEEKSEDEQEEVNENDEEVDEDDEEEEFVPTKLYTQVRHSDNEEHLPSEDGEDGRLREVIKDSKIQTIYTEEGYEDSAYDHAGHEKNAEDEESFAENEKNVEEEKEKKVPLKIPKLHLTSSKYNNGGISYDNDEGNSADVQDSDAAGSHHVQPTYVNKVNSSKKYFPERKNKKNFISTKETKTMTTKEKDDGNVDMEISGAIRVIVQPNNSTKLHKFIKVFPKIHKTMSSKYDPEKNNEEAAIVKEIPQNRKSFVGDDIFIEEIITTPNSSNIVTTPTITPPPVTTTITEPLSEVLSIEIPTTTEATTAIPKYNQEMTSQILDNSKTKYRVKRFTNDFPTFDIDTRFISEISHHLGNPKPPYPVVKYPYYENYDKMGLSENSPLRYSENIENIPLKIGGDLAFYQQAESKMKCPEVDTTVDPIPERVKNAESNHEYDEYSEESDEDLDDKESAASSDEPDIVKAPRLQGLGDKIDCMKIKYFGENPLDSPFFREELVGPVKPIFTLNNEVKNVTKSIPTNIGSTTIRNENKLHQSTHVIDELPPLIVLLNKDELLSPSDNQHLNEVDDSNVTSEKPNVLKSLKNESNNSVGNYDKNNVNNNIVIDKSNIANNSEVNIESNPTLAPLNLLTTPTYTIDLKPKHIYHQIELLNFLPDNENSIKSNQTDQIIEMHTLTNVGVTEINNISQVLIETGEREEAKNISRLSKAMQLSPSSKVIADVRDNNSFPELIPDAEALRRRKRIRLRRPLNVMSYMSPPPMMIHFRTTDSPEINKEGDMMTERRPLFHIFDVNKFLPTTQAPVFKDLVAEGSVLPKYKVVSEVFYKDEIKPNEQLTVLNDVINIIKNSSKEMLDDSSNDYSESHTVKLDQFKLKLNNDGNEELRYNKNPKFNQDAYLKAFGDQEVDDKYYTTITTLKPIVTQPYTLQRAKYPQNNLVAKYRLKKPNYKITTTATTYDVTQPTSQQTTQGTTRVMGLVPPGTRIYKVIPNAKRDNSQHFSNYGMPEITHMNKYWVIGMRPPPKQRIYVYSDFLNNNYVNPKNYANHRGKRSANRGSYAQLERNRSKQTESTQNDKTTDDKDDDYVPHRPKNFHYDENTGKIVYHSTKNPDNEDDEEEVYEEIIEEPIQTEKPKQNPVFATATPPPEGESYIDYVKKLKNAADYQLILDPTTTEKQVGTTEKISITPKPISTTPPEFLGILAKIRNNSEYKLIQDKKAVHTTTSLPEEVEESTEEEEDEEEQDDETRLRQNIKNSPGGDAYDIGRHFEIFDISDFIPKLRNYLPKTSVDTSKYKTIQRPNRQNVTNETTNEEVTSTSTKPQVTAEIKQKFEDTVNSGSHVQDKVLEIREIPSTTTSITVEPPAITTQRKRTRGRRPSANPSRISSTTTTETSRAEVLHHDKARRTYRRRPTRIQRPTTEKFFEEDVDDATKTLRRRSGLTDRKQINLQKFEEDTTDSKIIYNNEEIAEIPNEMQTKNDTLQPKSAVEIFQKFDPARKHGGNYRRLRNNSKQPYSPNHKQQQIGNANVDIVTDYNGNQKHGGNYHDEDSYNESPSVENIELEENGAQEETVPEEHSEGPLIVNLFLGQSEIPLTVDNKRTADTNGLTSKPNKRNRRKNPQRKIVINTNVQRLTDIVPKPESYYSDPNLPLAVNMLVDTDDVVDTAIKSPKNIINKYNPVKRTTIRPKIGQKIKQKVPKIITDPSKRLYFYAPV